MTGGCGLRHLAIQYMGVRADCTSRQCYRLPRAAAAGRRGRCNELASVSPKFYAVSINYAQLILLHRYAQIGQSSSAGLLFKSVSLSLFLSLCISINLYMQSVGVTFKSDKVLSAGVTFR